MTNFDYKAPNPYSNPQSDFFFFRPLAIALRQSILPALKKRPLDFDMAQKCEQIRQQHPVQLIHGLVRTHDNAQLDTIEITPNSLLAVPYEKNVFLIRFKANKGRYERSLDESVEDALTNDVVIVGFNYRGVGNSKQAPDVFNDVITDGIAQVQRLLDRGVPSEQIILDGESFGAATSTIVAAHFHAKNQPLYVWNDRSFSLLSKTAADLLLKEHPNAAINFFIELIKCIIQCLMVMIRWEAEAASAFKRIPDEYKAYMFVEEDEVISENASLAHAMQLDTATSYHFKRIEGTRLDDEDLNHKTQRKNLALISDQSLNAQTLFNRFVEKVKENAALDKSSTLSS